MHILSIGTDRKLFDDESDVRRRMKMYALGVKSLHVIVYSTQVYGHKEIHDGPLHIYSTQSVSRWTYVYDAYCLAKKIINSLVEEKTEIVVSSQDPFETGLVGLLVAREYNRPLQVQLHTDIYSREFGKTLLNRIRQMIASYVLPRAQGIRVVSRAVADSLSRRFGKRIVSVDVLPVFVDRELFENSQSSIDLSQPLPGHDRFICMVSRLSPEKNIDVALRAFAHVVKKIPQAGLCIVGGGNEERKLKALSLELGIDEHVHFAGWQHNTAPYYRAADLFVSASSYEGYGVTFIEAALAGCALVTTPVGIAREVCVDGENSYICPIGDINSLASRIEALLCDSAKRELFKTKMHATITGMVLGKEEYAQVYISLLEKIL